MVHRRLQAVIPQGENRWFVLQQSADQIVRAELLAALGVLSRPHIADIGFEGDSGRFTLRLTPLAPTAVRGYQEIVLFTLPNSGLRVGCSIFRYRFQPGDGDTVEPDQRIEPDWGAYRAGRDPVLDWILARPLGDGR